MFKMKSYWEKHIVGRSSSIQYPQQDCPLDEADENSVDMKYLQTFGSHIYFLQVEIREGKQVTYLKRLVQLFGLIYLPNLKMMELKECRQCFFWT